MNKQFTRREFAALSVGTFAALLAGCSSNETTATQGTSTTEPATSTSTETTSTQGKTLVAYYSAQGHTKTVAEYIAAATGAETFEITPTEVYSTEDLNYNNDDSRVCREHDDESLRDIALAQTTPDEWADYDTVFVGYPIWWAIAAWPTNNFIKDNDLSGKKIIPFCTSASSGLGDSATNLEALNNNGEWLEGQRFSSSASEAEVTEWVNSLSL